MKFRHYIFLLAGSLLLFSCNVTRKLPEDKYLLTRNRVTMEPEVRLPRSERVKPSDVGAYIRQRPNGRFLGMDINIWLYNLGDTARRNNRINRWLKKIGEAPVLYDTVETLRSIDAMSIYMRNRGFFQSSVEARADSSKRRVYVDYTVKEGPAYRFGKISFDFQDKFLEPIILGDSARTLLRTGDIYSVDVLQRERNRISEYLKDQGYYSFNVNNITFAADSTVGNHRINIRMIVRQRVSGFNAEDEPILANNAIYRIRDIYINTDYDPNRSATDSTYFKYLDTIVQRGVHFIYEKKLDIRPEVLLIAVNMYPNSLYNSSSIRRASDNLMRLNYFRSTNIIFSEVTDTSNVSLVTFIGEGGASLETYTRESQLVCEILCVPGNKQNYNLGLEGSFTQNFYGFRITAGYQNKNIFRGIEMLDISTTFGYEFMRLAGIANAFELGGKIGLTFPRFMAPIRLDRYNRTRDARTRMQFSVNSQNRTFYNRLIFMSSYGFTWRNRKRSSFAFNPIDINVVRVLSIDEDFLESITNPYLRFSFEQQLIAGMSGSYTYNTQIQGVNHNAFRVMINGETMGNLMNLVARAIEKNRSYGDSFRAFGIQFAQYARLSVDASYRLATGEQTSLAYRFFIGAAMPYGNSRGGSIPFERLFYAGGPNSMRGWFPRTLGPGSKPIEESNTIFPTQLGNLRLETNLEYRFPVYGFIKGAVFSDVGNVWFVGHEATIEEEKFRFNTFYKQLGFNTGLGARLDFSIFLFRLDWGLQMYNPNHLPGDRWIRNVTLRQSTFNFGIDYPF